MLRQYQPCIPVSARRPPSGRDWVHEIKHDGFRIIIRRNGDHIRLLTRNGFDWAERYPRIVEATAALNVRSVTIDGEAVVCGPNGVSDFQKLRSRAYDAQAFVYGFDLLELDGTDLRTLPLERRKLKLRRLLPTSDEAGIQFTEHINGDGAKVFEVACKMGLEGIVSKRRDMRYVAGKSKAWLKIQNPNSPAMLRLDDENGKW